MPQQVVTTEASTVEAAKQCVVRIGNAAIMVPAMKTFTETAIRDGLYAIVNTSGIPVPDAAPSAADNGAGVLTGTYSWRITFYNATLGIEGDPDVTGASSSPAAEKVLITNNATNNAANSTVTHWRIYRTLAGGSIYFFVAQVAIATTTYDDNSTDATIQANDTLLTNNDAPVVETFGIAHGHKGFCFMASCHNDIGGTAYDHRVTWSKVGNVYQFPPENERFLQNGLYGRITAMGTIGDDLAVYKEFCIAQWRFDIDPSTDTGDGFVGVVVTGRGCINKRCVADVQGVHFVMDYSGIYVFRGGTDIQSISEVLKHYWDRINWTRAKWFSSAVARDRIYFFVALDGETECKYAFVLDLNAWRGGQPLRWYVYKFDFGIRDSVTHQFAPTGPSSSASLYGMGNARVVSVLTEYGFCAHLGSGYRDLVDPLLTATGTATGGTTTTLADTTATYSRTNDASSTSSVKGAYLWIKNPSADKPGSGDWTGPYRITTVSGTTLTFTPAAPANVASGMVYYIGGLPDAQLHSPVYGFTSPWKGKRAAYLAVEFQPGGLRYTTLMEISLDRRAPTITKMVTDTSQSESAVYDTGYLIPMGGGHDAGRIGVHATPWAGDGFRSAQLIMTAPPIDGPVVIDAIYIAEVTEVTDGKA